jgi:tetratricopeptide (TPR) repeat protein
MAPQPLSPTPPSGRPPRADPAIPSSLAESAELLREASGARLRVGRYAVLSELGRGAMGIVYRAYDTGLRRPVALKMILDPARAGPDQVTRFEAEARATARLKHPSIVSVLDVGVHEGKPYLVMELVAGESLEALLAKVAVPPARVAELVREVALALAHAHGNGIVHRDVKPENVLVDREGRPHLMDFGLARDTSAQRLTQTGQVLGTPAYMAPEQADGDQSAQGPCSDIYSLGGILYRGLTGQPPFKASSVEALMKMIFFTEPARPRTLNPSIHADLETIALRCLAKEPGRRYPTADAVAEDLRRFLDHEPILARPTGALERAWRSVRRNRWLALALLSVPLIAALTTTGALAVAQRRDAARRSIEASDARKRLVEEHGRSVAAVIEQALAAKTDEDDDEQKRALYALTSLPEPRTVELLARALDTVSHELRGVTRDIYLSAAQPDDDEARAGEHEIAGLPLAVDRWLALAPGENPDRDTAALLAAAASRIERRARRRITDSSSQPVARAIVALAQEEHLGRGKLRLARLACEALGAIGLRDGAIAPLGRYLFAQEDQVRDAVAAVALRRLADAEGERFVRARGAQLGIEARFSARLSQLWGAPVAGDAAAPTAAGHRGDAAAPTLEELERATELAPGSADAWGALGRARYAKQDGSGAIAAFTRAIACDPTLAKPWAHRGEARSFMRDFAGAIADTTEAIARDARFTLAWQIRGRVKLVTGELDGALADLSRALELDPGALETLSNRGAVRMQLGDVDGAIGDLSRAIEIDPRYAAAWLNRGTARRRKKDLEGSEADLTQGIALNGGFAQAFSERALTRMMRGQVETALSDASRAIELAPDLGSAWHARADVKASIGDLPGSLADESRAIELSPTLAVAWANRARVRMRQGATDGAVADLTEALRLDPRMVQGWISLGWAHEMRGDHARALDAYSHAVDLAPSNALARVARGSTRQALGDADGAASDFDRAIALDDRCAVAWRKRGAFRDARGDRERAMADLTHAIELAPREADGWYERGLVRQASKDTNGAAEDFARALGLDPRHAKAFFARGSLRRASGDLAGARADWTRALELLPTGPGAEEVRALLAALP